MHRRLWLAWSLGMAVPALAKHQRVQRANLGAAGWPVGDFALTDHQGRVFTQESLRGRWTFVLLGDTQCTEACAAPLAALAALRRRIAGTEALKTTQVVFVSLDPRRDDAERLRAYVLRFDDSFIGATGPDATLASLADDLGVGAATRAAHGSMVLVGRDGAVRAQYLLPFDVPLLTAHYLKTRSRK
jgi:protein SCO1/2